MASEKTPKKAAGKTAEQTAKKTAKKTARKAAKKTAGKEVGETAGQTAKKQAKKAVKKTAGKAAERRRVSVTLKKSLNRRQESHKACVRGLGLRRIGHTVSVEDTPENRGMINKVNYLLSVEEA